MVVLALYLGWFPATGMYSMRAAEVTVGLAIIVALFRARQTTHVEDINTLKF